MKKIICLIFILILALTALSGCKNSAMEEVSSMMSQVGSAINNATQK